MHYISTSSHWMPYDQSSCIYSTCLYNYAYGCFLKALMHFIFIKRASQTLRFLIAMGSIRADYLVMVTQKLNLVLRVNIILQKLEYFNNRYY